MCSYFIIVSFRYTYKKPTTLPPWKTCHNVEASGHWTMINFAEQLKASGVGCVAQQGYSWYIQQSNNQCILLRVTAEMNNMSRGASYF